MDLVVWIALGAVIGLIAWIGFVGVKRMGVFVCVAIGVAAALLGGLATASLLGDIASVRVSINTGGSFAVAAFGLGPFLVAGAAALVALIVGHRVSAADVS
jgi:hypothetical protein